MTRNTMGALIAAVVVLAAGFDFELGREHGRVLQTAVHEPGPNLANHLELREVTPEPQPETLEGGRQWFDAKPDADEQHDEGDYMLANSETVCLAVVIFTESRGESTDGQIAVANVVMNRVVGPSASVCDIAADPGQFAWGYKPAPGAIAWRSASFRKALMLAQAVMWNRIAVPSTVRADDETQGATCFHAGASGGLVIGRHVFTHCRGETK